MASRSSSSAGVQLLDFSTLESSAPDSMPQKRRRTGGGGAGGEQPRNRNLPVPNAQFERELAATKVKYTRTVGGEGAEKLVTKVWLLLHLCARRAQRDIKCGCFGAPFRRAWPVSHRHMWAHPL